MMTKPVAARRRMPDDRQAEEAPMFLRRGLTAAAVPVLVVALAGCGSEADVEPEAAPSSSATSHVMGDGTVMEGSEMDMSHSAAAGADATPGMDYSAEDVDGDGKIDDEGVGGRPSETATMVCADPIREAVQRTLRLRIKPIGDPTWDGTTYTCTYVLPGGTLVASVRDDSTDTATTGRGYFRTLRSQLPGAQRLPGIIGLGFPSYSSPAGHVVFLKDHKTLHVDATGLRSSALPKDFTRKDVAYAVASAVMVCWKA